MENINKSPEEWKEILTDEEYRVTRERGTQAPYVWEYTDFFEEGVYKCKCCWEELFESKSKYATSCGWPSFDAPINWDAVWTESDFTHWMVRTEIVCNKCGAHLGHVFGDGPRSTTWERYCVNSISLKFEEK